MMKFIALVIVILVASCGAFCQTPVSAPAGCKQTPTVPDALGQANKVQIQSANIAALPKIQKDIQAMQQLTASLATDAKFSADKARMQQHNIALTTDQTFQAQKVAMTAKRTEVENRPERAPQLTKFQTDLASVCPGGVH